MIQEVKQGVMFRLSMDMDVDKIVTLMRLNRCRYVISEPNRCFTDGFSKLFLSQCQFNCGIL